MWEWKNELIHVMLHIHGRVWMRSEESAPSFGSVSPVPPQSWHVTVQACLPSPTVKPRLGTRSQTTEETLSSLPWLSTATCSSGTQLSQQKRPLDSLFPKHWDLMQSQTLETCYKSDITVYSGWYISSKCISEGWATLWLFSFWRW